MGGTVLVRTGHCSTLVKELHYESKKGKTSMNEQSIFQYLTKASLKVNAWTKQPRNTPGRVLLRILPGGVQPGSSNPDPISDQKM